MATVFDGVPALQPVDIRLGLAGLMEGLQHRFANQKAEQERNLLAQIGGQIQAGDLSGAAGSAFQAGNLTAGLDIMKMSQAEKEEARSVIGRHLLAADTPEKWNRIVPLIAERLGPEFAQEYGDFNNRDMAMAEVGVTPPSLSPSEILQRDKFAYEVQQDQSEPPPTIEGFDEAGRQITLQWDAAQQDYFPIKAAGAKPPTGGISVTHPDGTVTSIGGQGASAGLGKPAINTIEEKQIDAAELGSRISAIAGSFKPEYQTLGTKFKNSKLSWQAWLDPASLSEGNRQELEKFAMFRAETYGNLNALLKELSGAAISDTEGPRLMQQIPNPGTGVFDGDDPITFQAKMNSVLDQVNKSLARLEYYKAFGMPSDLGEIPLNNVKKVGSKWYVQDDKGWVEVGMP